MLTYYRDVIDPEALEATTTHVRENLSASADPNDDPYAYSHLVEIVVSTTEDGQYRVLGKLDQPARCPYLADGYDPFDVAAQPPRYTADGPLINADFAPINQQVSTAWADQ